MDVAKLKAPENSNMHNGSVLKVYEDTLISKDLKFLGIGFSVFKEKTRFRGWFLTVTETTSTRSSLLIGLARWQTFRQHQRLSSYQILLMCGAVDLIVLIELKT